jgi:hypothetical protein
MLILLINYSSSPPDGYAGDPPNNLYCTACHLGAPLNPGNGSVYISNLPAYYIPSDSFDLNIVVKGIGNKRFGFEMIIKDNSNNVLGTFTPLNSNTTVSSSGYVKHLNAPFSNDSFVFRVRWRTPSYNSTAYIYLVGNVANGNGLSSGDSIYSKVYVLNPVPVNESQKIRITKLKSGFSIDVNAPTFLIVEFYNIYGSKSLLFKGVIKEKTTFNVRQKGIVLIKSNNNTYKLKF